MSGVALTLMAEVPVAICAVSAQPTPTGRRTTSTSPAGSGDRPLTGEVSAGDQPLPVLREPQTGSAKL